MKRDVLRGLAARGEPFEAVPDLCAMSANRDPRLQELASRRELKIAACFPRAVRWLFAAAGAPLTTAGVEVLNMRESTAEEVLRAVAAGGSPTAAEGEES